MDERICSAIRNRTLIRFIYDGYERVVEPHLYGINSADHEAVSAWIVAGWTGSNPEPGWRNYLVADLHDLHVLATPFVETRPGYNPEDTSFRQIFCRLVEPDSAGGLAAESAPIEHDPGMRPIEPDPNG